MSHRISVIALIGVLILPVAAFAQPKPVCTPACPGATTCVWVTIDRTATDCVPIATKGGGEVEVEGVTVTAESKGSGTSFQKLVDEVIVPIVDLAVMPLLYALAFILFLIGIVRYFFFAGEEGREKGKQLMLWGIIGLVVIFSVWGIVKLLLATFNLGA